MNEKLKPKKRGHFTHGFSKSEPRIYGLWLTMKSRCENPNREKYKDYGARGITVCEEWQNAGNFVKWALSNGYKQGLQIDRIDNNKGYSPDNCRFVTPKENTLNRRNSIRLTIDGETKTVEDWGKIKNKSIYTIYWWIRVGGKEYAEQRLSKIA